MNVQHWGSALIVASISLLLTGCGGGGPSTYPATGTVTYADGTPVAKGMVVFTSDEYRAYGALDANGSFTLTTDREGDGAAPGFYKVYLVGVDGGGTDESMYEDRPPAVDPRYTDLEQTPLEFEVKPQKDNRFDIQVERP